jgi:tetratricopeptide (TPR) repeat protein
MRNTKEDKEKIAWVQRAHEYHLLGQYDNAIFACNQALQIDKTFARAHFGRALAFYKLNRIEFTLSALKQTIKYSRNHIRAYILAGNIYHQQEKYKRAVRAYSLALRIDPIDRDALAGKEKAEICQAEQDKKNLEKEKQNREREDLLEVKINKHISDGDKHYNENNYKDALEAYNAALQLDSYNLPVLRKRVKIYNILYPSVTQNHSDIQSYVMRKDGTIEKMMPF